MSDKIKALAKSTKDALLGKKKKKEDKDERSFLDKLSDALTSGGPREKLKKLDVKEKAKRKFKRYKKKKEESGY